MYYPEYLKFPAKSATGNYLFPEQVAVIAFVLFVLKFSEQFFYSRLRNGCFLLITNLVNVVFQKNKIMVSKYF